MVQCRTRSLATVFQTGGAVLLRAVGFSSAECSASSQDRSLSFVEVGIFFFSCDMVVNHMCANGRERAAIGQAMNIPVVDENLLFSTCGKCTTERAMNEAPV